MSAPFTPGPWYVTEAWGGFGSIKQTATDALIFGIAAGDTEEKQPDEVCEANARLIAAAPELYEGGEDAAEFLLATFGQVGDPDNPRGWSNEEAFSLYRKLRANAAKARGEQP